MKQKKSGIKWILLVCICSFLVMSKLKTSIMAEEKTVYDAIQIDAEGSYGGKLDGENYYQFTLNESGKITLTISMYLDSYSGSVDILDNEYKKLDAYGIPNDSNRGCKYSKKKLYFTAGTYYLKFSGEGTFSFVMDFESAGESFRESQTNKNEILDEAHSIALDKKYFGQIGYGDVQDFYKFAVPFTGQISISHYCYGDAHMIYYILDIEGNRLADFSTSIDSNKGYAHDVATVSLNAGEYYFKVYGDWLPQHGFYNFSITAKPNPAQIAQTSRNKSNAVLKIEKQPGATGYIVQYSTSRNFTKGTTKTKTSKNRNVKLAGLKKTKVYYVRVRTFKTVNGKTYYSNYGNISALYV